ncbi:putative bifunctional diguanylate cyclase/phosphodiesterase [Actinoplanes sp. NPDC049265]|uniref:putative bifunctional diguanylate cyclase/phosphodiesterase n=1 Tax=Actinoplanes sp. NPDC049265 TaxID=3363902 RepID=UPI00371C06B6
MRFGWVRADRLAASTVAACGVLLAGYLVFYFGGWGSEAVRVTVADLANMPNALVLAVFGVRVARQPEQDAGTRRAWWLITGALSSLVIGSVVWFAEHDLLHRDSYPAVSDYFFLAFVPFMLAGLLLLPGPERSRQDRIRLALDALIVGVSAFMVLWYLVLGPLLASRDAGWTELAYSTALPIGDLLLVLAVAMALFRRPGRQRPMSLRLLTGAVVLQVVADTGYAWSALHGGFTGTNWSHLAWLFAYYLMAVAAWRAHREAAEPIPGERAARSAVSWLPYAGVGLAYALLSAVAGRGSDRALGGMIVGAVLLTFLVVARQMYALRENRDLAVTDSLTGLANRTLITERLAQLTGQPLRDGKHTAVLVIDLDRFKPINDTYGHDAGDAVLLAVATALRAVIRAGDTAGRLGGDEFAVIINNLPTIRAALAVAERLSDALRTPVIFGDQLLAVEASIGVAVRDAEAPGGEILLHHAETATAAAKRTGRCTVYSAELDTRSRDADLRRGIANDELVVNFQPVVRLDTGRPVAVEALVRWQHPARGLLFPGEFIELAEETGAIVPLGEWVLRAACRAAARWRSEIPAARDLLLSVNLSPRQVVQARLVEVIRVILAETGFPPGQLVLELTESVVLEPDALTVERLETLRDMGVRFAVDDFGTGYAALTYLRRLPVSVLKIDRSFVTGIADDEKERGVAAAVVGLGAAFGLTVVAEGIETEEQADRLREMGCALGQGFHFFRPLSGEVLEQRLMAGSQ